MDTPERAHAYAIDPKNKHFQHSRTREGKTLYHRHATKRNGMERNGNLDYL